MNRQKTVWRPKLKSDFTVRPRTVEALKELGLTKTAAKYLLSLIEEFETRIKKWHVSWYARDLAWNLIWHDNCFFEIGISGSLPELVVINWVSHREFVKTIERWRPLIKALDDVFGGPQLNFLRIHPFCDCYAVVVFDSKLIPEKEILKVQEKLQNNVKDSELKVYFVKGEVIESG